LSRLSQAERTRTKKEVRAAWKSWDRSLMPFRRATGGLSSFLYSTDRPGEWRVNRSIHDLPADDWRVDGEELDHRPLLEEHS
jgi:hypothetical protein